MASDYVDIERTSEQRKKKKKRREKKLSELKKEICPILIESPPHLDL